MLQTTTKQPNNYLIIEPLQIFCWTYWTLLNLEIGNNKVFLERSLGAEPPLQCILSIQS